MNHTFGNFLTLVRTGKVPQVLVATLGLAVFVSIWMFVELADEVMEAETRAFDETILLSMRLPGNPSEPVGGARIQEMARDITALGGFTILTGVTLVGFGVAWFAGRLRLAVAGSISIVAGAVVMRLLKQGFDRPRPELVEHATLVHNPSFPSGHSMMAAMIYLTLGILLARTQPNKGVRVFIVVISVVVTALVGISRVYLGVHWPTDVIGGWMLGGAWAVLFWLVAMRVDPQCPPSESCGSLLAASTRGGDCERKR
jgi:undecaprenyl-diphosphatase